MFDNFNRSEKVEQELPQINEVIPEPVQKDEEYGICIDCKDKADIQEFKEKINKKNEQEKKIIYEFFKSNEKTLLLCEPCFPQGECATCGDEVSLEQCIAFRNKIDPRGEHGEYLPDGYNSKSWCSYNNIYLCKECDKKYGRYYCYYCTQPLTKKEIHHFYLWSPCPLDQPIYENKDTQCNPCCCKCYDKQHIQKKWCNLINEKEPLWNERLTLEDLEDHKDEIPQKRIQEENVNYGLARCANEKKDKSIEKLRNYLLEKEELTKESTEKKNIVCYFCSDKEISKEQVKEFQEKLDKAEDNASGYDSSITWQGNVDVEIDENFYICKDCEYEITCSVCDKLLTRDQIRNYINDTSRQYNRLNEGLCVGPAACTDCWIENDNELRNELGLDSSDDENEEE